MSAANPNDTVLVPPVTELPDTNPFDEITDQSVEQAAERFFNRSPEPTTDDDDAQQFTEPIVESPTTFDPTEQFFYGPGQSLTRQEIAAFAQFNDLLESDPSLARVILNHLRGGEPPSTGQVAGSPDGRLVGGAYPPVPPQPTPFPSSPQPWQQSVPQQWPNYPAQPQQDLDLSDPNVAYLYSQIQQQNAALTNYRQELQRHQTIFQNRMNQEYQAAVTEAIDQFRTQYELDEPTMSLVRQAASRLEVIPTIMNSGLDPVTGLPTDPSPRAASFRAMEIAAFNLPQVRDVILSNEQYRNTQDAARKSKLRAVGGSSKTAPRTAPVPTTAQERRKAMIDVVNAWQNGTYQESN